MRQDVPVPPVEDLLAQMQGDRGCQCRPCQRGSAVFVITQKVTDIDCVQSDTESQQKGKVRVKWREREEMAEHHAMS